MHRRSLHTLLVIAGALTAAPALRADGNAPAGESAAESTSPAPAAGVDALLAEGDAILRRGGGSAAREALVPYRRALEAAPQDPRARLAVADALVREMRARTAGNHLLVEGTNDTEAHRKIWRSLAPEAVKLSKAVLAQLPGELRAKEVYAEAYMYQSSSLGIVEAILKGAADEYRRNADALLSTTPPADLGAGHVYKASFYAVAPWPLADEQKALHHAEEAVRLFPKSVRNQYVLGVLLLRQGERARGADAMRRTLAGRCQVDSERDICEWLMREARRALQASGDPG